LEIKQSRDPPGFPSFSLSIPRHPTTSNKPSSQEVHIANFQHSQWLAVPPAATATARTRCVADFELSDDFFFLCAGGSVVGEGWAHEAQPIAITNERAGQVLDARPESLLVWK
jgi:hypothetical protein